MHFFTLALAALSSASVALSLAVSTHGTRPEDAVRRSSSSTPRLIIYTLVLPPMLVLMHGP